MTQDKITIKKNLEKAIKAEDGHNKKIGALREKLQKIKDQIAEEEESYYNYICANGSPASWRGSLEYVDEKSTNMTGEE